MSNIKSCKTFNISLFTISIIYNKLKISKKCIKYPKIWLFDILVKEYLIAFIKISANI